MNKQCIKCKSVKNVISFNARADAKDGYRGECKECSKLSVYSSVAKKADKYLQYKRDYSKKNRVRVTEQHRIWLKNNPEKKKAHYLVMHEIRMKRLRRQECNVCGQNTAHAHHKDYAKPLEVEWLCPKHHVAKHKIS